MLPYYKYAAAQIVQRPEIFAALNPARAVEFLNSQSQNQTLLPTMGNVVRVCAYVYIFEYLSLYIFEYTLSQSQNQTLLPTMGNVVRCLLYIYI